VLADKAYDADRIRDLIQRQGATPNIPPKSNRRRKPCFSKRLYRERNLIERFFSKLKHFRRVATRYDKLAANFLAMIQLASMRLWLRAYESTAEDRAGAGDGLKAQHRPHSPLDGAVILFDAIVQMSTLPNANGIQVTPRSALEPVYGIAGQDPRGRSALPCW
jgi:hypothetical protein